MKLPFAESVSPSPDMRRQVRHLGWFCETYRGAANQLAEEWGLTLAIDQRKLAAAFLNWADGFSQQRQFAGPSRRDFSCFAAGLMLTELLRAHVCSVRPMAAPATTGEDDKALAEVIEAWPEGFVSAQFCLSVLDAVLRQDFGEGLDIQPTYWDAGLWRSFRENAREQPDLAIGYLDLFVGNQPNWRRPGFAPERPAMRAAIAPPVH